MKVKKSVDAVFEQNDPLNMHQIWVFFRYRISRGVFWTRRKTSM